MILKLTLKHLISKPVVSFFTLVAVACSLTVLGMFWTVVENLQRVKFENQARADSVSPVPALLSIFLDSKLDSKKVDEFKAVLVDMKKFSSVEVVSSAEAQKTLEQQFGETLTRAMGADLLPITVKATLINGGTIKHDEFLTLMNDIRSKPGVLDIDDGSSVLPSSQGTLNQGVFSWAAVLLMTVFIMVALLVSHLVRLAFESLRPEVETLKVLGASKFWIFKPLLLEGLFFGVVGALLSLLLLSLGVQYLLPKLSGVLFTRGLEFQGLSAQSSFSLLGLAVAASVVGAFFTWPLIQKAPTEI